ncbi:MAG: squalene/phytoene synthase family protein [Rickettsiales bacterium]|nr:squalene/phytoene synthase family protein [Rickettsiales bacterium]
MRGALIHHESPEAAELISLVRGGDYDRFLAIQLAPKAKRAALYAVTALHVEVARIAETVSEPLIGHIRLAWWREGLEEIMKGQPPRNHPVLLALQGLYAQHAAVFPLLLAMVEARAADMDDALLAEEAAWLAYGDATAGGLHRAWAKMLDAEAARICDVAIQAQARAYAMIGLVRAIPFMARHGWARFPHGRLSKHQLESLAPSAQLNGFVQEVVNDALRVCDGHGLDSRLLPLIGTVKLAKLHAKNMKKIGYNPYALRPNTLGFAWQIAKITIF